MVSGCVALCLPLPGVVVTWFVTGFPDPGKVGGSHPVLLESALRHEKLTMTERLGKTDNVGGMIPSAVPCGGLVAMPRPRLSQTRE